MKNRNAFKAALAQYIYGTAEAYTVASAVVGEEHTVNLSPRRLAWMQRIAALAIVLFWISFWMDHAQLPAKVVDFEWCFLLPDILWIALVYWVASHWLIARDPRAGIATAVGGSSMVYLGLLDAACNFRHGQYTESFSRGALNAVVNAACILFGAFNIWYAITRRPDPALKQYEVR